MSAENENEAATEAKDPAPTMQDIKQQYFGAENLEKAEAAIATAVDLCMESDQEPVFNFDPEADFPDDYGIAIVPLTKLIKGGGKQVLNVCISAIPSVDAIANAPGGPLWIAKQLSTILIRAVKSAAMPKDDMELAQIPFKIDDFITSSRSSAMAAFNSLAAIYVKALKAKGLTFINKALLRQALSCAAFAEQQFPAVSQDNWIMVINSMIAQADKDGIEPGNLQHWLNTRHEVTVSTTNIDLTDIMAITADKPADKIAETAPMREQDSDSQDSQSA